MARKSKVFKRTLKGFLLKANRQFPVLLLIGARQVGKTTLMQEAAEKGRTYVTLDNPVVAKLAQEEPKLFLERYKAPLLIDEIQYAPELLPYIKMDVDTHKTPGRYWLTGSQQFFLMKGVSETLAGRVGIMNLLGLSSQEIEGLGEKAQPFSLDIKLIDKRIAKAEPLGLTEVYERIWRGSFPRLYQDEGLDWELFYSSYLQTYLQRDVAHLTQVRDQNTFLTFITALAARTGQLLNLSEISRTVGVSADTAKRWLSILVTSNIVYLLQPYHSNITKRAVKSPKAYFLDTGLVSYLTEWSSSSTLEAGAMSGHILENYVIVEVIKSFWHNGKKAPIYFYRDKDGKEVDLLIAQDGVMHPIEIKKTGNPGKDDVKHLSVLEKLGMPLGNGGVICFVDERIPLSETLQAIPVRSL